MPNGFIIGKNVVSTSTTRSDRHTLADTAYMSPPNVEGMNNCYSPSQIAEAKTLLASNDSIALESYSTISSRASLTHVWRDDDSGATNYGEYLYGWAFYGGGTEPEIVIKSKSDLNYDVQNIHACTLIYILDNTQTAYADKAIDGIMAWVSGCKYIKGYNFDISGDWKSSTWQTTGYYDQSGAEFVAQEVMGLMLICADLLREYMTSTQLTSITTWATEVFYEYALDGVMSPDNNNVYAWPGNTGFIHTYSNLIYEKLLNRVTNETKFTDRFKFLMNNSDFGNELNVCNLEPSWVSPGGATSINTVYRKGAQKVALNRGDRAFWYSGRGASGMIACVWMLYSNYGVSLFEFASNDGTTPMDVMLFQAESQETDGFFPIALSTYRHTQMLSKIDTHMHILEAMRYIIGGGLLDAYLDSPPYDTKDPKWPLFMFPSLFRPRLYR